MGCIYIAKDVKKPELCKIGLTKGTAKKRISQTENPDYVLHYEFHVADDQLRNMEYIIHQYFEQKYKRLNHRSTARKSEWFECDAKKAVDIICSGEIKGITPLNSDTGKPLNNKIVDTSHHRKNVQSRVFKTKGFVEQYFAIHISAYDDGMSCFVELVSVSDLDTIQRLKNKEATLQGEDITLSHYSLILNSKFFERPLVNVKAELFGRLESKFVREVDISGEKSNKFRCSPYKAYKFLTSDELRSKFPSIAGEPTKLTPPTTHNTNSIPIRKKKDAFSFRRWWKVWNGVIGLLCWIVIILVCFFSLKHGH